MEKPVSKKSPIEKLKIKLKSIQRLLNKRPSDIRRRELLRVQTELQEKIKKQL